jgi:hypothetical protein
MKYQSTTSTCTAKCTGNSLEICGDLTGDYYSDYTLKGKFLGLKFKIMAV